MIQSGNNQAPNFIITYVHKRPIRAFTKHVDHFLKFSPPMGLSEPYYPKYLYVDFLEPLPIPLPTGPHGLCMPPKAQLLCENESSTSSSHL